MTKGRATKGAAPTFGQREEGGASGEAMGRREEEDEASLKHLVARAREIVEDQTVIQVNKDAVKALADRVDPKECAEPRAGLPLRFDNDLQEINLHATVALLSFGVHYEKCGRLENTARDTILYGIIGFHISKQELDAAHFLSVSRSDVTSYFSIDPMELCRDEKVPCVQIERPGELSGYVDDIMTVFEETGGRLRELSCSSLARFILDSLKSDPTAARLVTSLHAAFPHFRDAKPRVASATPLDSFKKPLILAAELFRHLRDKVPAFAFSDYASLPPYVTPAIVNSFIDQGILRPAEGLTKDAVMGPEHSEAMVAAAITAMSTLHEMVTEKEDAKEVAPLDMSFYLDNQAVAAVQQEKKAQEVRWDPGRSTTW